MGAEEVFDPVAMGQLYDIGYRVGNAPDPWTTSPPGQDGLPSP